MSEYCEIIIWDYNCILGLIFIEDFVIEHFPTKHSAKFAKIHQRLVLGYFSIHNCVRHIMGIFMKLFCPYILAMT